MQTSESINEVLGKVQELCIKAQEDDHETQRDLYSRATDLLEPIVIEYRNELISGIHAAAADLLEACEALPDFDIENPDAADFKDNAHKFMTAMRLARAAIAKAQGVDG